jgi:DNA mismatch repair protein MutL
MGFSTPLPQREPVHERPPPPVASKADARDLLPVPRFQDLVVIGQFAQTYLVCEGGGELILIDQHAAHERVTLHQLQESASEHLGAAQRLLSPQVVELPASQATLLSEHLDLFQDLRLEVEPYGEGALAVRSVPPALAKVDLTRLLSDMATQLAEGAKATAGRDLTEHFLATMACHGSVRAHQVLSPYEMRELLVALDEVDFSVCAHGRPVAIRLSEVELERRFHRS